MRVPTRKDRDRQWAEQQVALDAGWPEPRKGEPLPMVAILGRPNVGKSTLFNRILRRRKAVVTNRPGVTRDRNIDRAEWAGTEFLCVDTGGYDTQLDDPLLAGVFEQVRLAIDEADVIVLLLASGEPDHPADAEIIGLLRQTRKPVLVAVNKCDSARRETEANEFFKFGFDRFYPISALRGHGTGDLLDAVVEALRGLDRPSRPREATGGIALAIVGRQNVGKSTLVNQLCGERRVIAAPLPGTTRDSIDTVVRTPEGKLFTLIDTAGIRRRGRIEQGVEKLSVMSAMLSMRRADVAALVIDGATGPTEQDAHVAGFCLDNGLATIILVNKWDLVAKDHRTADQFTHMLEERWQFLRYAPVLYISALEGQRVHRVFELAERVFNNARRRIPTHELNERLEQWVGRKPPAMVKNRRPKIRFITQTGVQPPTFTMFVNDPELFHFSYERYLINRLRETYDFEGVPLRLQLRRNRQKREDDPKIKNG